MRKGIVVLAVVCLVAAWAPSATAQEKTTVYLTNISKQIISEPVVVSHNVNARIFEPGQPASPELAMLAEDGYTEPLVAALEADPNVMDVMVGEGHLMPGMTMRFDIDTSAEFDRISAVGMLVTTNDAFFGLNNYRFMHEPYRVPRTTVPAYDAGTEYNNEDCAYIPGPPCGVHDVRDTDGAEGFIHVHPGLMGYGDLSPADWGWQNPVVSVAVVKPAKPAN